MNITESGLSVPEANGNDDAIRTVVGIGVIVVLNDLAALSDEDVRILTVREKRGKAETGKTEGIQGIVQETVKVDALTGLPEFPDETLLGAMEELVPREIGKYRDELHRVSFPIRPEKPLPSLGGNIFGGLEVVVFAGDEILIPEASEVQDPKWGRAGSVRDNEAIRPTSRELVGAAIEERLLSKGLYAYREGRAVPVFTAGMDFGKFLDRRNTQPDITEFRRG